jgi:hypothetical protein
MVVLIVISMAHAAGVGVGTVAETPEPDRMAEKRSDQCWYLLQRGLKDVRR